MRLWTTLLLCLLPAFAGAQDQDWVKTDDAGKAAEAAAKAADGWNYKLTLGSNVSFSHSTAVASTPDDGSYVQIGVLLNGEAKWKSGQHAWDTTLAINHQQSMTPVIDGLVKSADSAELRSMYQYSLAAVPWLGPFARLRLSTQLFPTNVVRAQDSTVVFTDSDGVEQEQKAVKANEREEIAKSFEPLILRETVGAFAKPYEDEQFTLNLTLGAGAQEVIAQDGYVVDAVDDDTNTVTVKQLQSYEEVGAEAEAVANGQLAENVTWQVSANVLHPFVTSADTDKEGFDLTNIELGAKLALRLTTWASLDYVFSAKQIPLVVDDWQVLHNLLFTAAFTVL